MGLYKNWTEIEPSAGAASLPEGAYVVRVTNAKDDPQKELVELTYDVAEGEHAGHYNDEWGQNNTWAHKFSRWYGPDSEGSFRSFLDVVEQSNPGRFSIAGWQSTGCAPSAFVGCLVGVVMRKRIYVPEKGKNAGKVQESIEVGKVIQVDDVRQGRWEPMEPRDTRKGSQGQQASQPQAPQPAQSRFAQQPAQTYQQPEYQPQAYQYPAYGQPAFDPAYAASVNPPFPA